MMRMTELGLTALCLGVGLLAARLEAAAVPSPAQLLPQDTLAVMTAPDFSQARSASRTAPVRRLWDDPAMKPFLDKFMAKLTAEVIAPFEKELGVRLADFDALLQGQFTLALVQEGWQGQPDQAPAWLVLLDARDRAPQAKELLSKLRKDMEAAGRPVQTQAIKGLEFLRVRLDWQAMGRGLKRSVAPASGQESPPAAGGTKSDAKTETGGGDGKDQPAGVGAQATSEGESPRPLLMGLSGSLLVAGSSAKVIEKLLERQTGASEGALADQPVYASDHKLMFGDSLVYGWVQCAPLVKVLEDLAAARFGGGSQANTLFPGPDKVIAALGLKGLRSMSFDVRQSGEGSMTRLYLGLPEAGRQGLAKTLVAEPKETAPPVFVGGEVVKYTRWRLDGPKFWTGLENLIQGLSPQWGSLLQMSLGALGKDKDASFDFRKSLIENLGDDVISLQKAPRAATLEAVKSPPSAVLLGSPKPAELAKAIKSLSGLMPRGSDAEGLRERDYEGVKVHSFILPTAGGAVAGAGKERAFHFAAVGGYLVMTMDAAFLEELVRRPKVEGGPSALRDTPGLLDAFQKAGGGTTGLAGYEDYRATARLLLEAFRSNPKAVEAFLPQIGWDQDERDEFSKVVREWLDLSLLPPYEQIARYLHFNVFVGVTSPEGFTMRAFAPMPPALKP